MMLINTFSSIDVRRGSVYFLVIILSGCIRSLQISDLEQFVLDTKELPPKILEPVPEYSTHDPYKYENIDGVVADLFSPSNIQRNQRKQNGKESLEMRLELSRKRDVLEEYELSELRFFGTVTKQSEKWAVIVTPDRKTYQVKVGDYMGKNFGKITQITNSSIQLSQYVKDEISGDWVKNSGVMPRVIGKSYE